MKCVICKNGETKGGKTTTVLERNGTTVVFKNVPASVCMNCGEVYLDSPTTSRLLEQAEESVRQGVEVEVKGFVAA